MSYARHAIRDLQFRNLLIIQVQMMRIVLWIILKHNFAPCSYICNMYRSQARAGTESISSYARYTGRNRDGGQAAAISECFSR